MVHVEHEEDRLNQQRRFKRIFSVAMALVILASIAWVHHESQAVVGNEVDDAGITFTFARNLAEGYGIVLYPGGERVEGYSNPTWMFLLAGGAALGQDLFATVRLLSLLFCVLCLIALGVFFVRAPSQLPLWPGLAVPLLVASHGTFVLWSFSGLEVPLFLFLLIAASYRLIRESESPDGSRIAISPFLFFLIAVTRPEGIGYFAAAMIYRLVAVNLPQRRFRVSDARWLAVFFVPWFVYQIWHYLYFAWPLPNTYYAKATDGTLGQIFRVHSRGWDYVAGFFTDYRLGWLLIPVPLAFLFRKGRPMAIYLLTCLAFALFFPLYARGDWMVGYRFCAPAAVFLFMLAALGMQGAIRALSYLTGRKNQAPRLALFLCGTAAFCLGSLALLWPASHTQIARWLERPPARIHGLMARGAYYRTMASRLFFDDYEATVLDMDMGGLSMASRMKIVDVGRLCDVPFAHNFPKEQTRSRFAQEYVLVERRPHFVHLRRGWGRATTLLSNPQFHSLYHPLPDDPFFGKDASGNYVRKDLIVFKDAPSTDEPIDFAPGLTLVSVRPVSDQVTPGQSARIRLFWRRYSETPLPDLMFRFRLEDAAGQEHLLAPYEPVMGWVPTTSWTKDDVYGEWAQPVVPRWLTEGRYSLFLQILDRQELQMIDEQPLPFAFEVGTGLQREAMDQFRLAMVAINKSDFEGALLYERMAREMFGGAMPGELAGRFKHRFCNAVLIRAHWLINVGHDEQAGVLLRRAKARYMKNPEMDRALWDLSEKAYRKGRKAQRRGDVNAAYRSFIRAVSLQPWNAWARKRAEQVRTARY